MHIPDKKRYNKDILMSVALPSKKIGFFALLVVALAGIVLWYLGEDTNTKPYGMIGSGFGTSTASSLNATQLDRLLASSTSLEEFNPSTPDPVYTQKDLKIVNSNSTTTVTTYAKTLKQALLPFSYARPYEAESLIQAVENKSEKAVVELKYAQSMHQKLVTDLKTMLVPSDLAAAHLSLLNQSAQLEFLLRAMVQVFEKPVAALQSGREFIDQAPLFFNAIGGVNNYFAKRKMVFSEEEGIKIYVNITQ
jgi:hypothetical protein